MSKEKLFEYKTIKNQNAKLHLIRLQGQEFWRFHNWDGPAIQPIRMDSTWGREFYLNGIKYNEEDYKSALREREGLPFYKQSGFDMSR